MLRRVKFDIREPHIFRVLDFVLDRTRTDANGREFAQAKVLI